MDTGAATPLSSLYIRRLSRLVETLLATRFDGAMGLWKLQLDLLELQREIQTRIAEVKQLHRSTDGRLEKLESLRRVLRESRRLGDSLAWVVFGLNRKCIYPLAANQRNPVLPRTGGNRALIAAAEALNKEGYGFPLLHDITDVLRIGDITFMRTDSSPLTVEVKSKVDADGIDESGQRWVEYSIAVHHIGDEGSSTELSATAEQSQTGGNPRRSRTERQLDRMTRARITSTMASDVPIDVNGNATLSVVPETDGKSLASTVNKAIWQARRHGIGSSYTDSAFSYLALYNSGGDVARTAEAALARLDIAESVVPIISDGDPRNALVVSSIPAADPKSIELHLPYFLLALPRRAILDILHGRLIILVVWNPARIAQALELAGFSVTFAARAKRLAPEMVVTWDAVDGDGVPFRSELHRLDMHLNEMIMELRPVSHVVDIVEAMRASLGVALQAGLKGRLGQRTTH